MWPIGKECRKVGIYYVYSVYVLIIVYGYALSLNSLIYSLTHMYIL